jgi:predicted DNA-binding transcriptional regulator YafY
MRTREDLPHLATVQEAVWQDRRLRVWYRRPGAPEAVERLLDPYGLVAKAGTWYLVGADGGEPRLYRVSRIEAAEVTDQRADRPAALDLEALWEELRGRVEERGPGVAVRARVRAQRVEMLLRVVASQLVAPAERGPTRDGWTDLELRYPAEGAARGSLLAFGPDVEVLAPETLRRGVRESARALVALYASDNRS